MSIRPHLLVVIVAVLTSFAPQSEAQTGGAPSAPDGAPDTLDVSTMINTGSGYDAWTGGVTREVVDFEVPGAVSEHGLKWTRTTHGGIPPTGAGDVAPKWSYAYTWRYIGRPFGYMNYPGGNSAAWAHTDDTPARLPAGGPGDRLPGNA